MIKSTAASWGQCWQLVPCTRCGNGKSSLADRGTSKSLFLADRRAERDGMSETGVSSCDR